MRFFVRNSINREASQLVIYLSHGCGIQFLLESHILTLIKNFQNFKQFRPECSKINHDFGRHPGIGADLQAHNVALESP